MDQKSPEELQRQSRLLTVIAVLVGLLLLTVIGVAGLLVFLANRPNDQKIGGLPQDSMTKANLAKLQCNELVKACETFHVRYGQMPSSLNDLVAAPNGLTPILKDQRAIIDPWNQAYQLKIEGNRPVVFTTDPNNGQKISSAN